MASPKEVRARQNRQKERIAESLAERRRSQQRRRRFGGVAVVIALVIVVGIGLAVGNNDGNDEVASPTSAPAKHCVGLKDPLPAGAPAMPLTAGLAPTKLVTKDLKVGTGPVVPENAKVTVNYIGVACSTGKIFDSSYSRAQTLDADLSAGVIEGWKQGVPGMRIGGVRLLDIPSDLGYGASGSPPQIGPDEPLFFLVAAVKLA